MIMTLDDALKIIQRLSIELACTNSYAAKLVANPRPGDLVFETSKRSFDGIGRLIFKRYDFIKFDEPIEGDREGYYDQTWYIEKLDGTLEKWRNGRLLQDN